jgi:hypothetical protein
VYAWPLERHLPRISIPLADDDPDIVLDLPAAFRRCWDEGPYPELLGYDRPAPGELTAAEQSWCKQKLGNQTGQMSGKQRVADRE